MRDSLPNISHKKQGLPRLCLLSSKRNKWHNQMMGLVLTIVVCFGSVQMSYSQQDDGVVSFNLPVRNSLTFNRYVVNPTFSFVREQNKYISIYNKREWVQFEDAPQTYILGYSGRFAENIGAGLGLFQQNYGVLTTFGGVLNFAYNVRLERDSNLTFGMNLGVYKSGINSGSVVTNFPDPSLNTIPSNILLTVNPGINYGTMFMDFGVSINNVVLYNIQSAALIQDDPRQTIQAHVMYTGYMESGGFFDEAKFSGLVRSEIGKENTSFSGIAMLTVPKGIWAQAGYNTLYGASGGLGINITEQIAIEYNFEKALGDLTNFGPSHELTLAYRFSNRSNYSYGDDEEVSALFAPKNKRVLASSQPTMDADTRAQLAAEAAAKREEIKDRAKARAEVRADAAEEAKAAEARRTEARLAAELKAKELADAEAQAKLDAIAKAKIAAEAEDRLTADAKSKEEAEAAKLAAALKAKELTDAAATAKADAQTKIKLAADAKAKQEADAAKLAAELKAKQLADATAKVKADAEAKAKLAADAKAKQDVDAAKLSADQKAKELVDAAAKAKADAEAKAKLAADSKAKQEAADAKLAADLKAKELADAATKAKADAEAKAKLAADSKAKQEADAAKLAAEQKAKELADAAAKAKADAEAKAKLTADAKVKEQADAAKVAAELKAKQLADAAAKAKTEADAKAKADADAKAKLAADAKAKQEADAAKLAAEQKAKEIADAASKAKTDADAKAKADAEAKAKLAADSKAKQEADAAKLAAELKAKELADAVARQAADNALKANAVPKAVENPTDANSVSMKSIADFAEKSKNTQNELIDNFNEVVASKDKDLQDLKEENDLSERGIYKAPRAFKSISEENNKLQAIRTNLDNSIETNSKRIKELENLYDARMKTTGLANDEVSLYYQKTIKSLKSDQLKAVGTRTQLIAKLKQIEDATEVERKRRIKRAAFNNEQDRFVQDRAFLNNLKQKTQVSAIPLKSADFDFGEEQSSNIQILKNIPNVKEGFYIVVAVHTDIEKRDEFLTKTIASGQSNVDFFYDVNTSKYFIYYQKLDTIEAASNALKTKGSQPYNAKMSIIKIEN